MFFKFQFDIAQNKSTANGTYYDRENLRYVDFSMILL
jgi:hypothetical protein